MLLNFFASAGDPESGALVLSDELEFLYKALTPKFILVRVVDSESIPGLFMFLFYP